MSRDGANVPTNSKATTRVASRSVRQSLGTVFQRGQECKKNRIVANMGKFASIFWQRSPASHRLPRKPDGISLEGQGQLLQRIESHTGSEESFLSDTDISTVASTNDQDEFLAVVRTGGEASPDVRRWELWQQCFLIKDVGDVEELQANVPGDAARQINVDVPRTQVQMLSGADHVKLQRVLRAYAGKYPSDGYCQGMSSMAAVFVISGFDEKAALQGLCSICHECCPGYFSRDLRGYIRDLAVLNVLARELLPAEALQRLDSLGTPLHTLAADHFLTLGSHTWPLASVVQFWDIFLLEGSPAVFASFLSLLQLYLPEAKAKDCTREHSDSSEQVRAFQTAVSLGVAKDLDIILERTWKLLPSIPMTKVDNLRYVFSGSS